MDEKNKLKLFIENILKNFNKEYREIRKEENRLKKIDSKLQHFKKMYELRSKIEEKKKESDILVNKINPSSLIEKENISVQFDMNKEFTKEELKELNSVNESFMLEEHLKLLLNLVKETKDSIKRLR